MAAVYEVREQSCQEELLEEIQEVQGESKHGEGQEQSWRVAFVKKDLFDLESGANPIVPNNHEVTDWRTILKLAFQCIGVVYGDLGTSPLYVLPGIFPNGIKHQEDLLGVLSLIIYSLFFITFIKYVFIVLAANDNGEGGTFALYSLICRYAKISMIPNQQAEDSQVSNYKLHVPKRRMMRASVVKSMLENSKIMKCFLLLITMLGVSMVIGDGILTPCISVLSAIGGIKVVAKSLSDNVIMWVSVVILILLFQIQRFGTDKVGYTFTPVLLLWFGLIGGIGLFNFIKYEPTVIKALNPWYIVRYFMNRKKEAWISLGGIILCLTGSEAFFADLGHFNIRSIQISTCSVVFPSILLAYIGQCSYLWKHTEDVTTSFYSSIPSALYWPQFVIGVLAAIIASQSMISACFSIVQQAVAIGCFPRVKVVHTSSKYEGQVYIPEINNLLMLACVGVTLGFKTTLQIGNAYGLAVAMVFVITSSFLILVMVMIWKTHAALITIYVLTVGVFELAFLSSVLYKFVDGGYIPLLFALVVVIIMLTWNYGYRKKYKFEVENKVSTAKLIEIMSDPQVHRVQGLGLFYTGLVQGVSPIFTQYVSSVPALHSVLLFVSIKSLTLSKVPLEERFLFQRVQRGELMFRCILRYGYKDSRKDQALEEMLVRRLKDFIQEENDGENVERELNLVDTAIQHGGIVYLLGESEVMASEGSTYFKKVIVDYLYNWLTKIVRRPDEVLLIPRERLLKVGMTYSV